LIAAASAIALVLLICVGGWLWWLPSFRPHLRSGKSLGIDVSAHQGRIRWDKVAGDGISFAYIKATEGGDFTDTRFDENWKGARAAGVAVGAYHFFTLCTTGEAQAEQFLQVVPDDSDALPPAVDLELAGNCGSRPALPFVRTQVTLFLERVERAVGKRAILYVGHDFAETYPLSTFPPRYLWKRRILRRPSNDTWLVWQVHGYARVSGIGGRVDLDVMRSASTHG